MGDIDSTRACANSTLECKMNLRNFYFILLTNSFSSSLKLNRTKPLYAVTSETASPSSAPAATAAASSCALSCAETSSIAELSCAIRSARSCFVIGCLEPPRPSPPPSSSRKRGSLSRLVVGQQRRADLRGEEEAQGAEDDAAEDKPGGKAAGAVAALGAGRALRRAVRGFQEGQKRGHVDERRGEKVKGRRSSSKASRKNNRVRLLSLFTPIIHAKLTARRELSMRSWSNDAGKTASSSTRDGRRRSSSGERRATTSSKTMMLCVLFQRFWM